MSYLRSPGWVSSLQRPASGGGSGFLPTDITGLRIWFDGADATTMFDATVGGSLVAPGGSIARWEDKSGNAKHLTQGSAANRPTRQVGVKNSLGAVQFDGTSTSRYMASSDTLDGDEFTWFFVAFAATTTNNYNYLISYQNVDGAYEALLTNIAFSSVDPNAVYPSSAMNQGLVADQWNYASFQRKRNDASGLVTRRNGVQIVVRSSADAANPSRSFGLGAALFSTSSRMIGYIAEAFVYNSYLSPSNMSAVESYLASKWAI